jgi:hypothetical protein
MIWVETTNPERGTSIHKWTRVFDIRNGGAIETEWLDPSTGAAFAVLSAHTQFSFRVGYGAPGVKDVVDVTSRFGPEEWRFDPRDVDERAEVRDRLRAIVRAVLDEAGGVLVPSPERPEHAWKANVVFRPKNTDADGL